jgi:Tfp pilus assembly PilM family ATPase
MIGAHKLNSSKVDEIKELFQKGMTDQFIAEKYGVSRILINQVRNGHRWNYDKNSFIMKQDMKNTQTPTNHAIVSVMKDNEVVDSFSIGVDKIIYYAENIESVFTNNTGGWTIRFVINI